MFGDVNSETFIVANPNPDVTSSTSVQNSDYFSTIPLDLTS